MDCLNNWPEPVVSVQTLSSLPYVQERYIRPPSQRPTTINNNNNHTIPTIDLAGLKRGLDEETMRTIGGACREWGFFKVVNHGVDPDLLRLARGVWREFFYQPIEEKRRYANSPATYEGFGSRLGVEKGAILDWGDYFFLHVLPERLKNPHKWPKLPSSCREITEEYSKQLLKLCGFLMKVLSLNLGLGEEELQKAFGGEKDIGACLRVNYYPKCPQPELTLGLSPHSDPGGFTLLYADDHVEGLQVRKNNEWISVKPAPDTFIVNIADQIQILSNGIYKSVEHRVLVNSSQDRVSLAFFYNPRSDIPLGPFDELVTPERPALYQPMTYDEYRLSIRKKGLKGKLLGETMK